MQSIRDHVTDLCTIVAIALLLLASGGTSARADAPSCTGTVVNLSCDSVRPAGGIARCDPGEQVYALDVPGGNDLRPLVLAGEASALARLRSGAFTGREVRIVGSCPASGAIRVEEVIPLG